MNVLQGYLNTLKHNGNIMNYTLQKLFFSAVIAVSLSISTLPSYAKDEADAKPQNSKIEKPKKEKAKKKSKKKDESKRSGQSKATENNAEKGNKKPKNRDENNNSEKGNKKPKNRGEDNNSEKGDKKPKNKGKDNKAKKGDTKPNNNNENTTKDSKKEDKKDKTEDTNTTTKNSNKQTAEKNTTQKRVPANTSKKQFKDIIVNINKADAKTFSHYLMGIGAVKAKAIVAYRNKNGKFKELKELLKIEGIGEKIFAGLKNNISLNKGEESAPKAGKSSATKAK